MKKRFLSEQSKRKVENRLSSLEIINEHLNKTPINEANVPNVSPEVSLALFGKIFAGNPEDGVVPGANPMSDEEKRKITYKVLKDVLKKNGHDPKLADKWFMKWVGKTYED